MRANRRDKCDDRSQGWWARFLARPGSWAFGRSNLHDRKLSRTTQTGQDRFEVPYRCRRPVAPHSHPCMHPSAGLAADVRVAPPHHCRASPTGLPPCLLLLLFLASASWEGRGSGRRTYELEGDDGQRVRSAQDRVREMVNAGGDGLDSQRRMFLSQTSLRSSDD